MKSGVTLKGKWSGDSPNYTMLVLYRGVNNGNTAEDAVLVYDGVSGAVTEEIFFEIKDDYAEGDIVPGNIGNICMDVRNSEVIASSWSVRHAVTSLQCCDVGDSSGWLCR